ncbi:MAG: hypothetical protein MUD08_12510 [Cytophagales bacterium]|nr:hypothetical protein [Cytophagales bacterium]
MAFVRQHQHDDVQQLLLQQNRYPDVPMREAVLQIQARRKAQHKLPGWFANDNIFYPSLLALEQCSSEATARFKAGLAAGRTLVDLTGGMGVDTAAFGSRFEQVTHVEQNAELSEITAYNLEQLGITNVRFENARCEDWLAANPEPTDWLYLDPARRDDAGGKVVRLQDCEPPVLDFREKMLKTAAHVLLKTSPMLDIDAALRDLEQVAAVYVVAVENEVKELLFHLTRTAAEPEIFAVNLAKTGEVAETFRFTRRGEASSEVAFGLPETFVYEPNAAVLKAGAFRSVAAAFGLRKLHVNSHLYTSTDLRRDFPGRAFRLVAVSKLDGGRQQIG